MNKLFTFLAMLVSMSANAMNIHHTETPPSIDGIKAEAEWQKAKWHPLQYLLVGTQPDKADFDGQFRLLWDEDFLYLQVEITDDVLIDTHADPLERYWDDDCLEIFIDEDASGGIHQFSHNAFAYHIALDNQAVDFSPAKKPALYNDHLTSRWQRQAEKPNTIIWEVALRIHSDKYQDDNPTAPVKLHALKKLGFMLAYCDNDGSPTREHFVSSHDVEPLNGDKNRGYIDASVFGKITLVKVNER